jgi:hypothetical protein
MPAKVTHAGWLYTGWTFFCSFKNNVIFMKQKFPIPLVAGVVSALAAGLTLLFITKKKAADKEQPSAKAPQLNIGNPGTQDEFPKPPIESELG